MRAALCTTSTGARQGWITFLCVCHQDKNFNFTLCLINCFFGGDETNVINFKQDLDNSAEFNFTAAVQDFHTWDELKAEMKCSVYYKKKIWIK